MIATNKRSPKIIDHRVSLERGCCPETSGLRVVQVAASGTAMRTSVRERARSQQDAVPCDRLPPKIICVSSGKGGVGKTSFSVNVAEALSQKGKAVLLIDGDLGLANVDVVLGLNVRHTIRETIEEGRELADTLVEINPNFHVLPASSGVPEMANLSFEEQALLTSSLEEIIDRFDYVLIDTAAGIGDSVLWFNLWSQENIVILTPDPTSLTDAYALIKVLNLRHDRNRFHLLINNAQTKKEGMEVFTNIRLVLERFLKITPLALGIMPQDKNVSLAIRQQRPFLLAAPESKASLEIIAVAERLIAM